MANTFSDIKNKDDLYSVLTSMRLSAVYDLFGQICLHETFKLAHKGKVDLKTIKAQLPEGEVTLFEFAEQLNKVSSVALVETKRNANRFLTRNLLKEAYRITDSYCSVSGQFVDFKAQAWYQFSRIIVNSVSHNFCLNFRNTDKKVLPVSYMGETIDISYDGKPISMKLEVLINVVDDIIKFVKDDLKH